MQFGEQIHGLRKRRGLSQERFAQELHVTRQAVSNWENNKNLPDLETLIAMSGTFDVSLDELILGEDMRTMKTNDLVAGGNSTIGPEAGGQTARKGMGGAAACPDTGAPAMTDIARKLINDSNETRRAHDNKVTPPDRDVPAGHGLLLLLHPRQLRGVRGRAGLPARELLAGSNRLPLPAGGCGRLCLRGRPHDPRCDRSEGEGEEERRVA